MLSPVKNTGRLGELLARVAIFNREIWVCFIIIVYFCIKSWKGFSHEDI